MTQDDKSKIKSRGKKHASCSNNDHKETQEESEEYKHFILYFRQSNLPPPEQWARKSHVYISSLARVPYINYNVRLNKENDQNDKVPYPLSFER